jgi:hypothetical protein
LANACISCRVLANASRAEVVELRPIVLTILVKEARLSSVSGPLVQLA